MNDFFANLYELFGTIQSDFCNDMYQESFYMPLGIIMIASAVVVAFAFYYMVNHPRFNRWYHWVFVGIILSGINLIADWIVAQDMITDYYHTAQQDVPYGWYNFLVLSLFGALWSFVFYFLSSFIIKWGSRNCKHTPFL